MTAGACRCVVAGLAAVAAMAAETTPVRRQPRDDVVAVQSAIAADTAKGTAVIWYGVLSMPTAADAPRPIAVRYDRRGPDGTHAFIEVALVGPKPTALRRKTMSASAWIGDGRPVFWSTTPVEPWTSAGTTSR